MQTAKELLQRAVKAGHTQLEIQKKTGVSQATISRILSGDCADPRSSTLAKLKSFKVRTVRQQSEAEAA